MYNIIYIYIYKIHKHQHPIWVSLIWEGPIAYRVFLTVSINFHKPMSVQYIFSIAEVFAVAHIPWKSNHGFLGCRSCNHGFPKPVRKPRFPANHGFLHM